MEEKHEYSKSGKRIRTISGWKLEKGDMKNCGPERMVQNDASSEIRSLLTRYSQGILPPGQIREGNYSENPDFDDVDMHKVGHLDPVDQSTIYHHNQQLEKQHLQTLKEQADKAKAEKSARIARRKAEEIRQAIKNGGTTAKGAPPTPEAPEGDSNSTEGA